MTPSLTGSTATSPASDCWCPPPAPRRQRRAGNTSTPLPATAQLPPRRRRHDSPFARLPGGERAPLLQQTAAFPTAAPAIAQQQAHRGLPPSLCSGDTSPRGDDSTGQAGEGAPGRCEDVPPPSNRRREGDRHVRPRGVVRRTLPVRRRPAMSASSVVDRRRSPDAVLGPPDAADARADDDGNRTTTSVPVPPPARSLPSTFPSFGLFASCTVLLVGVVTSLVFSGVGRDYEVSERARGVGSLM